MRHAVLLIVTALGVFPDAARAQDPVPVSAEWVGKWRADLDTAASQLERFHIDLYHTVSRDRFRAAIDSLKQAVPRLAHHEIVVELARIMVLIADGHTRLTLPLADGVEFFTGHANTPPPHVPGLAFRQYPLRVFLYDDGVFVRRVSTEHAEAAGMRVVAIGDHPIDDAMAMVAPTIRHDNVQQVRYLMPQWLVIPEILHARGVIQDMERVRYVLEDGNGRRRDLVLGPVPAGETVQWTDARSGSGDLLSQRHPGVNYWFEYLAGERLVYVRYAEVRVQEGRETIEEFAARLYRFIDQNPVERVVFDIRGNVGGNGEQNRPLLHGAIRSDKLRRPGSLFAIIDRGTFSAALMFAMDLERHTPVIFVGETMGAKPNHYGDSRRLRLPNTGLTIRASTRYWQLSRPTDRRDAVAPMIPVPVRSADYATQNDPVLDAVLSFRPRPGQAAGRWSGVLGIRGRNFDIAVEITETSAGWSGVLSIPALEVERVTLRDVVVQGDEVRFTWVTPRDSIDFVARAGAQRLIGFGFYTGFFYPVALERAEGREDREQ